MEEYKLIYVIYDPLYEKVICVHNEPDIECNLCKFIKKERIDSYQLEESEHLLRIK
jgi:hypothetical protein